jgi:hypothetical protein
MTDWFSGTLRRFLDDTRGTILQIEDRDRHPNRDEYGKEVAEPTEHERRRWVCAQAANRARLARFVRDLASVEDWDAVVADEEAEAGRLQGVARQAAGEVRGSEETAA